MRFVIPPATGRPPTHRPNPSPDTLDRTPQYYLDPTNSQRSEIRCWGKNLLTGSGVTYKDLIQPVSSLFALVILALYVPLAMRVNRLDGKVEDLGGFFRIKWNVHDIVVVGRSDLHFMTRKPDKRIFPASWPLLTLVLVTAALFFDRLPWLQVVMYTLVASVLTGIAFKTPGYLNRYVNALEAGLSVVILWLNLYTVLFNFVVPLIIYYATDCNVVGGEEMGFGLAVGRGLCLASPRVTWITLIISIPVVILIAMIIYVVLNRTEREMAAVNKFAVLTRVSDATSVKAKERVKREMKAIDRGVESSSEEELDSEEEDAKLELMSDKERKKYVEKKAKRDEKKAAKEKAAKEKAVKKGKDGPYPALPCLGLFVADTVRFLASPSPSLVPPFLQ